MSAQQVSDEHPVSGWHVGHWTVTDDEQFWECSEECPQDHPWLTEEAP